MNKPRGLRLSWPEVNCLVAAFDAAAKAAKKGHALNPWAEALRDRAIKRKAANNRLIDRLEPTPFPADQMRQAGHGLIR